MTSKPKLWILILAGIWGLISVHLNCLCVPISDFKIVLQRSNEFSVQDEE